MLSVSEAEGRMSEAGGLMGDSGGFVNEAGCNGGRHMLCVSRVVL